MLAILEVLVALTYSQYHYRPCLQHIKKQTDGAKTNLTVTNLTHNTFKKHILTRYILARLEALTV